MKIEYIHIYILIEKLYIVIHTHNRNIPVGVRPSEYADPSLPKTEWTSTPYISSSLWLPLYYNYILYGK